MKSKTMNEMARLTEKQWGPEKAQGIISDAAARWEQLCRENRSACREKKAHFTDNIFPCISYYEALQKNGVPAPEALRFLDESWSSRARRGADSMKKLLRVCGLYRLYPAIFRWVAKHQFGTEAGFAARDYPHRKGCCKFDMTQCLFLDTCRKYGCPELTPCFCHTDDINNADLHPRLCWNRTQFMGNGGSCCDFELCVKQKNAPGEESAP